MPDSLPPPVTASVISAAILQSPAVTRLGLACPSEQLREIVARLRAEADQLSLSL